MLRVNWRGWLRARRHRKPVRLFVRYAVLPWLRTRRNLKRLWQRVGTGAIAVAILISTLVPGMFSGLFAGHAAAATASQGPRTATASGDCVNNTGLAGTVWTNPGNAFSDNATYANVSVDGTNSNYIWCTNFGFSIPSNVTIAGIVVTVERKSDSTGNGGSADKEVRVIKGGSIAGVDRSTATTYTTSDVKEDHGGSSDLWGTTFSISDINASNFGAAIAVQKANAAGAAHSVTVDVVQITVYYSFNPTFTQSSYQWFANQNSATAGTALNSQDAATTALAEGTGFRLRMTLHVGTDPAYVEGSFAFKLQYAQQGADALCDTSFTNESYADVTTSTAIAYYDNAGVADGATAVSNGSDPVHSGHTNVYQDYNEANNASLISSITAGQDGLWDFALKDNGAPASTAYCFRMVTSAGVTLNTYSVIPMITTLAPDFDQTNYQWYNGQNAVANNTFLQTLGSSTADEGRAIVQTSDGGYAVVGPNIGASSSLDLVLSKFDTTGTETWSKSIGSTNTDIGYGLVQTRDGGYAVTGSTQSYGAGSLDLWISKFNSSGVEQWTKTLGDSGSDIGKDIIQTSDNGFVVTGQTASYGAGGIDIWLIKFDSTGVEQWTKTLGGSGSDIGNAVIQTPDGSYVVTSTTNSFGNGGFDGMVSKFNSSGVEQWSKTIGSSGSEGAADVIMTSDGGFVIAGDATSLGGAGGDEIILSKFDSSGVEQWTKTLGSSGGDAGNSVALTSDGGFAVTGSYSTNSGDMILSKFDSSGVEQWSKSVGGSGADVGNAVIQTSDGGYAVAGTTASYGTGGDAWLAKFDYAGDIKGCASTICTTLSLTEGNQSVTEHDETITEADQSLTESDQSISETDRTSTTSTLFQAGHITFGVTLGGTGTDDGYGITQLSDGSLIMAGSTTSNGAGSDDLMLSKFDATGVEQWTKTLGNTGSDLAYDVVATSDGGFVTTGRTALGAASTDAWLSKFNSSGVEQWTVTLGDGNALHSIQGNAVIQAADGGYVVVSTNNLTAGSYYTYLSKFNSSGVEQWTSRLAPYTGVNGGYDVLQVADGGYVIVAGTTVLGKAGEIQLTKVNSSGVEQWTKTVGGSSSSDYGYSVTQTTDGGFVVTGETFSYGTGGDLYLTKFDSSGVVQWTTTMGGSGEDVGNAVIQTSDGGLAVAGYTTSYGVSGNDVWLIKFDSTGVEQWTKTVGGSGSDIGRGLVQTVDGGYAVVGSTASFGAGNTDVWIMKFGAAGETTGCSSGCTFQSLTETSRSPTSTDEVFTETAESFTEATQTLTETNQNLTENYASASKVLWTETAAVPGPYIGSQDTAGASTRHDAPLRLRLLLHATKAASAAGTSLKLQVAARVGGTCESSNGGESYADIGSSVAFDYYDSSSLADGDWARVGPNDPTAGTVLYENYEESANFTNRHYIAGGSYGLWDISLTPTDTALYGSYCFKVVKSDNSPLAGYTTVIELSMPPAPSQQMRHGKFFDTDAGTRQPMYW